MILSSPRLVAAERFDLEDYNALLSSARTDSALYTKEFLSANNYIVKGFAVSGIGLTQATIGMADATLIIPQTSSDYSYFISEIGVANLILLASSLTDGTRNYVELSLTTQIGTPLQRALWDPNANSGAGQEFNQTVDTVSDLAIIPVVLTSGFSGSPDRLPLCIIDVDSQGVIRTILDRRNLYFRLSQPSNLAHQYAWGTKVEPPYTLTLSGVSGTFVSGETISINTETAIVVSGGTTSISFNLPSGVNFFPGSTVTGHASGATGTVNTVLESFSGVDKSILNQKADSDAVKTEIAKVKGTALWWQDANTSLNTVESQVQAINTQLAAPAYLEAETLIADQPSGTTFTLPVNSRAAGVQQYYVVGNGSLEIFLNGQELVDGTSGGWAEVGTNGTNSSQVIINQDLVSGDSLLFRLAVSGGPGTGSGSGGSTNFDFSGLSAKGAPSNADYVLIYDTSTSQPKKESRANFLSGISAGSNPVNTYSASTTADSTNDAVILVNAASSAVTISLPVPSTCGGKIFYIKRIDNSANAATIACGQGIDAMMTVALSVQFASYTIVADATANTYWIL